MTYVAFNLFFLELYFSTFALSGFSKVKKDPLLLRCAIWSILRLQPASLVVLAPECSGFSFMCSSQAKRYWYSPLGDERVVWVKMGNVMSCRVTLLCWLCVALGHVFLLEQPGSAKFGDMPRFQHFCQQVAFVLRFALVLLCCFEPIRHVSIGQWRPAIWGSVLGGGCTCDIGVVGDTLHALVRPQNGALKTQNMSRDAPRYSGKSFG